MPRSLLPSRASLGYFTRTAKAQAVTVATIEGPKTVMERVDLTHVPDFALGDAIVRPSTREVESPAGILVLEPRVMQVLVTLHRANGRVVSRDDLSACCWEGRVVGDDAINRVLSRLRRVAEEIGRNSFRIETITKVGYRLIETAPSAAAHEGPEAAPGSRPIDRRRALIGLAGAGGAAAVGAGLWFARTWRDGPDPRLPGLMRQAEFAMSQCTQEGYSQAIGLYRRAIAIEPADADAWGALAVAYACTAQWRPSHEGAGMRARAIEAANRALQLESGNSYATVAITAARPMRGNWLAWERAYRHAMLRHGENGVLACALGGLLCAVGRCREAAAMFANWRLKGDTGPGIYYREVMALWSSDQLEAADRLLREARELYPTHFALWFADCYIKMHSGRASAAIALIEDVDGRPTGIPADEFDRILMVAQALLGHDPAAIEAAEQLWLARARKGAGYAENTIQFATALGRLDDAFRVAEAYFFNRGFVVPEVRFTVQQGSYTPFAERQTAFLFNGSLKPFRADSRFDRLAAELGLQSYWARVGTRPDFMSA